MISLLIESFPMCVTPIAIEQTVRQSAVAVSLRPDLPYPSDFRNICMQATVLGQAGISLPKSNRVGQPYLHGLGINIQSLGW